REDHGAGARARSGDQQHGRIAWDLADGVLARGQLRSASGESKRNAEAEGLRMGSRASGQQAPNEKSQVQYVLFHKQFLSVRPVGEVVVYKRGTARVRGKESTARRF